MQDRHQTQQARSIVIAGGSGFIGRSLAAYLKNRGYSPVILSRAGNREVDGVRWVTWDARSRGEWEKFLDGAHGLVNLVGRTVDCIKTPDHQDEILRSRVEATDVLGQAMKQMANPPPVWVQMSTAHIYGDPPEIVCTEDSPTGIGLAPFVGRAWEHAFSEGLLPTQRGVVLRTSFVIGRDRGAGGSALSRLKKVVLMGMGGRIGSGRQGMSWIHETDMNRLFERAITNESMRGIYIASTPEPVAQAVFMRQLRRVMRVPIGLPAFEWMIRIGARWVMRTDPELALYGRYVVSKRLKEEGFVFQFPQLSDALKDLFAPQSAAAMGVD